MITIDQIESELNDEGFDANEIMALEIDAIELTGDGSNQEFIRTVERLRNSGLYERDDHDRQQGK